MKLIYVTLLVWAVELEAYIYSETDPVLYDDLPHLSLV